MENFIHFFGTGTKELNFEKKRKSGGIYLQLEDTKMVIDPGINTFSKLQEQYSYDIDGIILSHIHIDHANDINICIEWMTNGGKEKRGTLIAPKEAMEGENRVIYGYLLAFPQVVEQIKTHKEYTIKNVTIIPSIEHRHGVENYGFKIITKKATIGIVTDTRYFPELMESYIGSELLIINVPYDKGIKPTSKHLDIEAVEEFIKNVKPKQVVLTHFGTDIIQSNPDKIAERLSDTYGISVIAAKDDMILEIK